MVCTVEMNEDRRKEPPNPREPIELPDDNVHENDAAAAVIANQSWQIRAASPAATAAAQVHSSVLR